MRGVATSDAGSLQDLAGLRHRHCRNHHNPNGRLSSRPFNNHRSRNHNRSGRSRSRFSPGKFGSTSGLSNELTEELATGKRAYGSGSNTTSGW